MTDDEKQTGGQDHIAGKASRQARQTIDRFINRFSQSAEGYRALARHAAMPFILTPELLNYIRTEFLSDRVDWVAEADLLLSDLCQEIGHEQYAMKLDVRDELIAEAKRELGGPRMEEIARRLLTWVHHLAQADPRIRPRDLQVQQWGAMVYLKERREEAVRQMASALAGVEAAETAIGDLFNRAEISRVSAIISDLAHQLEDYRELVEYAALTTRLLNDPTGRLADRLSQEKNLSRRIVVAGIELAHLQKLIPSTPVSPSTAAQVHEPTESDPHRRLQQLQQEYDAVVRQISEEEQRLPWVEPENTDWDYRPPATVINSPELDRLLQERSRLEESIRKTTSETDALEDELEQALDAIEEDENLPHKFHKAAERFFSTHGDGSVVTGKINWFTGAGVAVQIEEYVAGFCSFDNLSSEPPEVIRETFKPGTTLRFKIIDFNLQPFRLDLSARAVIEDETEKGDRLVSAALGHLGEDEVSQLASELGQMIPLEAMRLVNSTNYKWSGGTFIYVDPDLPNSSVSANDPADNAVTRLLQTAYERRRATTPLAHFAHDPSPEAIQELRERMLMSALTPATEKAPIELEGRDQFDLAFSMASRLGDEFPDGTLSTDFNKADTSITESLQDFIHPFIKLGESLSTDISDLSERYQSILSDKRLVVILNGVRDIAEVSALRPPQGCAFISIKTAARRDPASSEELIGSMNDKIRELMSIARRLRAAWELPMSQRDVEDWRELEYKYVDVAKEIDELDRQFPHLAPDNGMIKDAVIDNRKLPEQSRSEIEGYVDSFLDARLMGSKANEAFALDNLGQAFARLQEYRTAIEFFNRALQRITRDSPVYVQTLIRSAAANSSMGNSRRGVEILEAAVSISVEHNADDKQFNADLFYALADRCLEMGDHRRALDYYTNALRLYTELEDRPKQALALEMTAEALSRFDLWLDATRVLEQAAHIYEELGDRHSTTRTLEKLSAAYEASGKRERAIKSAQIEQAVKDYQSGKNREESFRLITEYYHPRLIKFFARRGFPSDLREDLTQDVFLRLYKNITEFRGSGSVEAFDSWLFQIAEAISLDQRRRITPKHISLDNWSADRETPEPLQALGIFQELESPDAERLLLLAERLRQPRISMFKYDTVTLDERGREVNRRKLTARQLVEDLGDGVMLELVEMPGGKFLMGTSEEDSEKIREEHKRYGWSEEWIKHEMPQHEVTVPPFYIGKFAITQIQWRAVADWEKVERDLDPDHSYFKNREDSDNRPVELVSWEDAKEFCARLAERTGRLYRLPSEAEWEYACRAGATTTFAFGETITHETVNYNSEYPYAKEKKRKSRAETIPVGSLGVANAFGLFDMHGNVREWCEDLWHGDYDGAPTDGSAWLSGGDPSFRVLRGGSWDNVGGVCRSADRFVSHPDDRAIDIGFRVVVTARTS